MPQLKKVVLAMGNTLIYRDTYEEALADFGAGVTSTSGTAAAGAPARESTPAGAAASALPAPQPAADTRVPTIRDHLRRYRELVSQGKWAEAGRELEAVEKLVGR